MAGKKPKPTVDRNRIALTPSDEQIAAFTRLAAADERPLATWALRRLWKAVQEDIAREKR